MIRKSSALELYIVSTAIGLVATVAAPWIELRGTFASWRLAEWQTFWRGGNAFLLADVVASTYQFPVEYATVDMQSTLQTLRWVGGALAVWHGIALAVLMALGARQRRRAGASRMRVAAELVAVVLVITMVLAGLTFVLALPSSLTLKVDFRTLSDIHTDSLVWSELTILPVAPAIAVLAAILQLRVKPDL